MCFAATSWIQTFRLAAMALAMMLPAVVRAQDDDKPVEQRKLPLTFRADGGIGFLSRPIAMKNNFYSVGDINAGLYAGIFKGIRLGANFRYTGYQVSRNASNFNDQVEIGGVVVYQPIRTTMNMYTANLILGYDRWVTPYSLFNFSVSGGQTWTRYTKIRKVDNPPAPEDYNFEAGFVDGSITFIYFFEDHLGMTIRTGYARMLAPFKPETVALNGGAITYTSDELKGNVGFFSVALGFAWSLSRVD
jgi:hypothetical protein